MKNKLIWMLLAALGFATACSDVKEDEEPLCEYGCPWVTYSVKGKVTNAAGEPVKGIDVRLKQGFYAEEGLATDENGEFAYVKHESYMFNKHNPATLLFTDVDGELNGSYETQEVEVSFVRNEDIPSDDWYNGDYIATEDVEVVLQEKTSAEE